MIKLLEQTRRHDITFNRNGRILITARVARLLDLRPGDCINIGIDNGECLLYVSRLDSPVGRHVAQCYPTKRNSRHFRASSVELSRRFLNFANVHEDQVSFMIGNRICKSINGHVAVFLPIIYKMPL